MSHCVGNGGYYESWRSGKNEYYSLRDRSNRPHVTVEVGYNRAKPPLTGAGIEHRRAGSVLQCKGHANAKPAPEYQRFIRRFFNDMKWDIQGDLHHID